MKNEQLKTAEKILVDKKFRQTTSLCVEMTNSWREAKGKLGHVVKIRVCCLT